MQAHDIIATLRRRGVTLLATAGEKLRVEGVELLTETEKATLKAHKVALLEALRQPAETINNRQNETLSRAPWGLYAPNCNRCWRYNWRSEICQRQGRLEFANTPPCQGRHYQPFALTLAEREAVAGAIGEGAT